MSTEKEKHLDKVYSIQVVQYDSLEQLVCELFEQGEDALYDGWYISEKDSGDGKSYSVKEYIRTIKENHNCWGFYRHRANEIHMWKNDECTIRNLLFFLGHEIGHAESEFETDDKEEKANGYGRAADIAWAMIQGLGLCEEGAREEK